jgi:hypothetical protein
VDFQQTLYQQYRSALAGDPDGIASSSPKTEFTYVGTPTSNPQYQGRITKIKDKYGRVTTYEWNHAVK